MKRQVLYYGNPILRKHCEEVKEVNDEIRALITDMLETMDANNAAGLAAPQIGELVRIFVLRDYLIEDQGTKWTLSQDVNIYINPKIEIVSKEEEEYPEGCLSLPNMRIKVWRPIKIKVHAIGFNGEPFEEIVEGYNARVRLHENDHLNGVLTIDRVDPKTRRMLEPHLRALKKKYNPEA